MKKKIFVGAGLLVVVILATLLLCVFNKKDDNVKFSEEYDISLKNIFVYRSVEDIIKILENGTGIVYLGFPECPWCKEYVKYLNKVGISNDLDKIYYYDILDDRKNNTDEYKKIVELLNEHLRFDDEGNKRVYVPAVISVKNGKITGYDDETSYDTKGYDSPSEYWKNEDLDGLIERLDVMIQSTMENSCSDCNK